MTWPAAVLWDLDGTLADTEPLWMAAEHALAERFGRVWTEEDALALIGSDLMTAGEHLRRHFDADMTAAQIVDFLVQRVGAGLQDGVAWRPGAKELVTAFAAAKVPQALVTMSYAVLAEPIARQLPFAAVVTGDAVSRGKPHPEPYLTAAAQLGVDAAACLAIEDSVTGAASATAAGCEVLVVPHMVRVPDGPRRRTLPSLAGTTPDTLRTLFA
ncbi:HAD hydrolase, family IA, variant 3 [Aeromicrobium marinum DSM 15272]|uniref:HAD hydrolase, family IA, variant 3 n=1 Tax=Aeromicrobium marinum DSM 15272 TaxID=585531 RepID=E2S9W8_9ACTN|nr:HAD family phosphatase [Aeromicrobium marinum]EFQ84042.1 HAD hydrolase, family IA, variant 3 [Aeromicrobium marinum DSM 15272]